MAGKIHRAGAITRANGFDGLARLGKEFVFNQREVAAGFADRRTTSRRSSRRGQSAPAFNLRFRRQFVCLRLRDFRRNLVAPDRQRHARQRTEHRRRGFDIGHQAEAEIRHARPCKPSQFRPPRRARRLPSPPVADCAQRRSAAVRRHRDFRRSFQNAPALADRPVPASDPARP